MAKNVQGVIFLRNNNPYASRNTALTGIESKKSLVGDGQFILARYNATENNATVVKTLVGVKAGDGANGYLTIIDVEGASTDVEKLREEINAKLGTTFISSGNTVEANLTALSGTNADTSATTSVAGAKAYADDLISTLDGGVTAETGYFVKSVSEVDGKISGTTEALPSYDDEAVAKKFVIAVDETNGQIEVTRGEVTSTDKTVVLTDGSDGGIDLAVNIDGVTLEKNENGVISVASAALTQYVGDEDTIHISAVDTTTNTKTVSSPLTISATTPSEANVKEQYNLVGASGNTIGATIKIYKDSALLSVALLHAITTETPQVLPTYDKATSTWTDIDATAQTQANQALCYAYEDVSGNTVVAAVPVGAFINEQEFASGVTWDATAGKVKGVVDPNTEVDSNGDAFLTVGADGFKVDGIKDEIEAQLGDVVADLDATVTGETANQHISISIEELDGKLVQSGLTITESNIANADDLAELSGKTITAVTSTNGSIAATISNEAGNKTADIQTDADKIQMSGFSADNTSSLSGIAESDSIATAFEKTNAVITENERVTAAALNGLRTDVDTVSGNVETISGDVNTIKTNYVSGVSVNGNAVTVANHVAPISISGSTSAATPTSTEAIVVDTDANGNVTLGLGLIDCGTY